MRRLLRIAVAGAILLAGLFLAVAVVSRTPPGREWIRGTVERALAAALGGTVHVGRVSGGLVRDVVLHDVRVVAEGRTIARIGRIEVEHDVQSLLRGHVHIGRLTVVRPRLRLVRDAQGWRLPVAEADEDEGRRLTVDVAHLEIVDGRVALALLDAEPPRRLAAAAMNGEASVDVGDRATTLRLAALRFVPRGAALTPAVASGTLVLDGGNVRSDGFRLETQRSRIHFAGIVVAGERVDAQVSLEPLAARELAAALGSHELRSDVRGVAAAAGPWNAVAITAGVRFEAGGKASATSRLDLSASPIAHASHLRFTDLDPGAAVADLPRGRLTGHARARGAGFGADVPWRGRLVLAPSELEGRQIDAFQLVAAGRHDRHRARARAAAPAGTVAARATLRTGQPITYRASADVQITRLEALAPEYPGTSTIGLTLAGRGTDPATREATLQATLAKSEVRGIKVERGGLKARLAGERVAIEKANLEGRGLKAELRGSIRTDGTATDLTLIAAADLAAVDAAVPTNLGGLTTVRATARGPIDSLALSATGDGQQVVIGTTTVERASLRVDLDALGSERAKGRAQLSASHLAFDGQAAQAFTAAATWAGAGTETRGELQKLILDTETTSWRLARPARFTLLPDAVTTPGVLVTAGAQRIELSGRLARTGANDARVAVTGVDLAPLCALAETRPCNGTLALRGTVAGTAEAPRLAADLTAERVGIDEVSYGTITADLRYDPRKMHVAGALRHPDAGEIRLRGDVPMDLAWAGRREDMQNAPIDLTVEAERLDLRFVRGLAPATLRSSDGRLTLALRLTGPRAAPRAFGDVTLRNGRIELTATGVAYHNVRVTAVAMGDRLEVQELRARTGEGVLDGSGTIGLGTARSAGVGVRIALKDFLAIRRPAYEAVVSGALDLTGTLAMPELRGAVKVDRGVIRPGRLPTSAPSLDPDPTIVVVNAPPTAPEPPPPPPPPLLDPLRLDVEVELGDDVSIRRVDAHIRLGGKVRVRREPFGSVSIEGLIRLLRGWYAFQGRRFEVRQGVVWFSGEIPARPSIDVLADHRAGEYTVQVHIDGWIDKPRLTLSSEPPLDQADVLAVLLFGKPSRSLGRSDGLKLQQNAVALASGYVMPELQASVMDTLGLSSLEVSMPDGTEPGKVGVGRYVTSDLFVSLAQEFGARAGEVLSVEYGLTPRISVRGTTSSRGSGGIDFFWSRRY
jgi:autotransporter translocation and assembly factor TamB